MPTIKARIGGAWVPVGGGGAGADEVWIGTAAPTDTATELWYDTDEPNLYEPDTARWNSAWGVVATITNATDYTGIAATETLVNSGTFTAVAGRKYALTIRQAIAKTVATDVVYVRASIDTLLVLFTEPEATAGVTRVMHAPSITYSATTAGSKQVYVSLQRSSGTGTVTAQNYAYINAVINVYDVGPVSLASSPPAQPSSVWTAPTLLNGWANSGGSHQTCQYRLLGDKVELRGRINLGTIGVPIFTLPVGYRPTATTTLATATVVSGNWAFGVVEATVDGNVAAFAPTTNVGLLLNNLSFSVTA